jgi:hypothetical protein
VIGNAIWAVDFMLFEVVVYAIFYALHYAFWGSAICHLCRGECKENDTFRRRRLTGLAVYSNNG